MTALLRRHSVGCSMLSCRCTTRNAPIYASLDPLTPLNFRYGVLDAVANYRTTVFVGGSSKSCAFVVSHQQSLTISLQDLYSNLLVESSDGFPGAG